MHYTTWRDDQVPITEPPSNTDAFHKAMISVRRHARRWRVFAIELIVYTALFLGAAALAFSELAMDREDGFSGARYWLYIASFLALVPAVACATLYSTKGSRSVLATCSRKIVRVPVGITFAWMCSPPSFVPGKIRLFFIGYMIGGSFLISIIQGEFSDDLVDFHLAGALILLGLCALIYVGIWTVRGYNLGLQPVGSCIHRSLIDLARDEWREKWREKLSD